MRAVALACLALACGSGATPDKPAPSPPTPPAGARVRLELELDTGPILDDRMQTVRRDLEMHYGDHVTVTPKPPSLLEVTSPGDVEVLDHVLHEYAKQPDTFVVIPACNQVPGPPGVCIQLAPDVRSAIAKAARANAITTILARLDAAHATDVKVTESSEHIVIELPESQMKNEAIVGLTAKTGTLELEVVDDGSPYMKKLCEHVGKGTDGVTTDTETWTDESGKAFTDCYLVAHDRDALDKYVASLDPSFKVPDDHHIAYERRADDWRTYYLVRRVRLSGRNVGHVHGTSDPNSGRPVVLVDLDHAGTDLFADVTTEIAGHKLATLLDGRVISAPVVRGPIRGGRVSIAMAGPHADADRDELVAAFKLGSLPAPLRLVSSTTVP